MSIRVGIVGAAGYAGIELVRLVVGHPDMTLTAATSDELAGKRIDAVYPGFSGVTDLFFCAHASAPLINCDVVFLAVPHTAALAQAPALVEAGVAVIDLSADFRLRDPAEYEHWYGVPHTAPNLLSQAAFGLPELFMAGLERAHEAHAAGSGILVACAGCYPTATSLAAAPALAAGFVGEGVVVADAVSGVTGAGKKATERTHYCHANENVEAYGVATHRHTPEIEQILDIPGRLVFTPHLAPLNRGLLSTVTLPLKQTDITQAAVHDAYISYYAASPFVHVLTDGSQPQTSSVAGTNNAHVACVVNTRVNVLVATCAIDNIGKGAAGQAMQCANIVCGLDQATGLQSSAIPVL